MCIACIACIACLHVYDALQLDVLHGAGFISSVTIYFITLCYVTFRYGIFRFIALYYVFVASCCD